MYLALPEAGRELVGRIDDEDYNDDPKTGGTRSLSYCYRSMYGIENFNSNPIGEHTYVQALMESDVTDVVNVCQAILKKREEQP